MRRGTAARLCATLTTVAVVAALAACTGEDPEPGPTASGGPVSVSPSPVPTPSETPAPETVAPERPEAMDDDGVAGAEATARYFLELYPYVHASGDLTEWRELSHPECQFCRSVTDRVERLTREGHSSSGGEVDVHALRSEETSADFVTIYVDATQSAAREFDGDGDVVHEAPESDLELAIAVEKVEGTWLFRGLETVEGEAA